MNIGFSIQRTINIIAIPKKEFSKISKEQKKIVAVFAEAILPFFLIYAVAYLLSGIVIYQEGLDIILKKVVFDILVAFISIYVSTLVINELLPLFLVERNSSKIFALVAFSLTPLYLASIMAGIFPSLAIVFNLFVFYSIYLFWIGVGVFTGIQRERRQVFVPLILVCILVIFLIVRILLGTLFSI